LPKGFGLVEIFWMRAAQWQRKIKYFVTFNNFAKLYLEISSIGGQGAQGIFKKISSTVIFSIVKLAIYL